MEAKDQDTVALIVPTGPRVQQQTSCHARSIENSSSSSSSSSSSGSGTSSSSSSSSSSIVV